MVPEIRCECTALILDTPPRAARTLLTISSAVCAAAVNGIKKTTAKQSNLIFRTRMKHLDFSPHMMVWAGAAKVNLER
jgi:hypothetical protein